jgi:hypothetical protein
VAAIRQKLHLSLCPNFRDQFFGLVFARGHRSNSPIILVVHSPNSAGVLLVWA